MPMNFYTKMRNGKNTKYKKEKTRANSFNTRYEYYYYYYYGGANFYRHLWPHRGYILASLTYIQSKSNI